MADLFSGASAQITPFNFGAHAVRIVVRNGEPWFVASDVAEALGYRSPKDAAASLGDHQKGSGLVRTPGGEQRLTIINESGLYRLVLRSRKPEAEKFSDWVTGEVLPSIRKTGSYGQAPTLRSRRWLISTDAQGREHVQAVAEGALVVQPAELAALLADAGTLFTTSELLAIAQAATGRLAQRASAQNIANTAAPTGAPALAWRVPPAEVLALLKSMRLRDGDIHGGHVASPEHVERMYQDGLLGPRQITKLRALMGSRA